MAVAVGQARRGARHFAARRSATLAGVAPNPVVSAELALPLVHDRTGRGDDALAFEERAIVAAGEKARFWLSARVAAARPALAASRRVSSFVWPPSGKSTVSSVSGLTVASMYDWSLRGSAARATRAQPVSLDDAGVVAGPESVRPGPRREGDERVEAERAVAAAARVGGLTLRVPVDEGRDDGRAELLAQVERDVRQTELVTGLARGHDGRREQHARSGSGPRGSSQRRSVTPTASGRARSRATALSTPPLIATAMRPGAGAA